MARSREEEYKKKKKGQSKTASLTPPPSIVIHHPIYRFLFPFWKFPCLLLRCSHMTVNLFVVALLVLLVPSLSPVGHS